MPEEQGQLSVWGWTVVQPRMHPHPNIDEICRNKCDISHILFWVGMLIWFQIGQSL